MSLRSKLPLWFLVIPLLLFSTGLVSTYLGADSLSDDEKNTVKHLVNFGQRFTIQETISSVNRTSPQHVPGYHVQVGIWSRLVGLHFVLLRTLSLFFFTISIAMIYRFAYELYGSRIAFFVAFFVAFCGFNIDYAHAIRMYSMSVMQTIGLLWAYWRLTVSDKPRYWYHWFALLFFSVYGIYTQIIIIFPLIAIAVYHLLFVKKTKIWFYIALTEALAGLLFLPWLPSAIDGANRFKDLTASKQSIIELLFNGVFIYSNGFWTGGLILIGLLIWKYPKKNRNLNFVVMITVITVLSSGIFNELFSYIPARRLRYTMVWLPVLALLWGYGLMILYQYRRWLAYGFLGLWLVMLGWFLSSDNLYFYSNLQAQSFRDRFPFHLVGEEIKNHYDDWLGQNSWLVFFDSEFLYQSNLLNYYQEIYHRKIEYLSSEMGEQEIDRLDKIDNNFPGFWFSYRPADEPQLIEWQSSEYVQPLFDIYHPCLTVIDDDQVHLAYYLDKRLPCELITSESDNPVQFNNSYILRQSVVERIDSELSVSLLWWNADFVFDNSFGFSLQVFRDGEKVGQTDYPIDNFVTHQVVSLSDTSAGNYSVQIIVYSSDDVSSIGGQTASGVVFERSIEIASFQVED